MRWDNGTFGEVAGVSWQLLLLLVERCCLRGHRSQTEYALTSSQGNAIGYLLPEHISVSTSDDDGETWTVLATPADYTFTTQGTRVVLTTAPVVDTWVRIKRTTPMDENWVDYQSGNLLTAGQLNEFESWQLYIDQELAVRSATLTAASRAVLSSRSQLSQWVDSSDPQLPVISIDETDSTGDPNALTSDTRVMSEKAIDQAFKQHLGTTPTMAASLARSGLMTPGLSHRRSIGTALHGCS